MHGFVLFPIILSKCHDCLVVWLRQRETVFAHERAENAIDLTKREAEMLRGGELEKNVMHQRCVDVARRVWSADPHAKNFAFGTAPIPSVALGDVEYSLFNRCPDSPRAITERRIAVEERDRRGDNALRDKAIDIAVSRASVVCAKVDHLSGD